MDDNIRLKMKVAYWIPVLFIMFAVLGFLTGCKESSLPATETVNIRIRNTSSYDIDHLWLGSGEKRGATQTTAYGRIKSGATTSYKRIEPIFENYDFADIKVNGDRLLDRHIKPMDHLGVAELSPGQYYTFVYDIIGDEPYLVEMIHEVDN